MVELPQFLHKVQAFYDSHYKKLVIITQIMLFLAIAQIAYQVATTGDFINKGISLKGGITVTVADNQKVDINAIEKTLKSKFPQNDINVRTLSQTGSTSGLVVEADFKLADQKSVNQTIQVLGQFYGKKITNFSVENISASLSAGFFREVAFALVIAFIFMGIVVIITFRSFVPSFAVISCGLSDIVETIAIVNLTGMRLGTSAIAAFLMLIGYSVDTDILLTTKLVRSKEGTMIERLWGATKTGLTMTITTMAAVTVGIIVTQSEAIKQIMIIILIGLIADVFNTWIQNVAIIRWFAEKKEHKNEPKV